MAFLPLLAGCDVFSPRTPEPPLEGGGTYEQPDTPEQVVANLQAAVAELNTLNYRRSLAEDLTFKPTATAEARDPIWTGWSRAEEERYFSTLAAAAQPGGGHRLDLNDRTLTLVDENRYLLDATYVLSVNHRRTDAPTTVQGRLQWVLTRDGDGLWHLREWTDQELGNNPSWSDLKAAFVQ
ncbi:hypothetical protein [Rhodocaloribacter litoris]|uniref:hypothetical protein n=1 Tax=Rhodocaloribacter litoris TaxID=2558931 RepID=UPI001E33A766|nr:hypothetical protein [Rhodocaloribacter litoris]